MLILYSSFSPYFFFYTEINAAFKQTITGGTSTRFHYPIGCCLLKDGRLVVADTGTNTVKILLGEETQVTIGKKVSHFDVDVAKVFSTLLHYDKQKETALHSFFLLVNH